LEKEGMWRASTMTVVAASLLLGLAGERCYARQSSSTSAGAAAIARPTSPNRLRVAQDRPINPDNSGGTATLPASPKTSIAKLDPLRSELYAAEASIGRKPVGIESEKWRRS